MDSKFQVSTLKSELATLVRAIGDIKNQAPPPPAPSIPIEPLITRIGHLEAAFDDSKMQVSTVKSEVATVVRAIGDIKNQAPPPPAPSIPIEPLITRIGHLEAAFDDSKMQVSTVKSEVATVVRAIGDIKNQAPPPPAPSIPIEPLITRIGHLEAALDDSKMQVSTVKSEVATLVRAIGDIKKQARRPEVIRAALGWPGAPRASKSAAAILAAFVGLSAGVFGSIYFTTSADSRPPSVPEPAPVQEAAFVPSDQPVAPPEAPATSPTSPKKSAVAPVPVAARAPAQDARVRYVGALSIDSQPGGEVFLNRASAGRTPLRLNNLRAGSHLIWVESNGYRRWTRVVQVPADRVTRLFADLEPTAAR